MKSHRFWGTSTSAFACLFYAATTAWIPVNASAQTTEQTPTPPTPDSATATPSTVVDDNTIDKFAAAYTAVSAIQMKATDELKTTSDPQKAAEVKRAAESQALQAVQSNGLQPAEFNRIAQAMAADEQLRTRVASKLSTSKSGGG